MTALPVPLTPPPAPYPADTRAKGWRFELDHERIRQSDTWALAPPEIRPWLLMLWMTAWEQTPCGSLPDDDELIAARIGMPLEQFQASRKRLLRGWWQAEDGRLYHDTIIERVMALLAAREKERAKKAGQRKGKGPGQPGADAVVPPPSEGRCPSVPELSPGTNSGHPRDSTGIPPGSPDTRTSTGTSKPKSSGIATDSGCASAPESPPAAAFVDVLQQHNIAAHGADARLLRWAEEGATPAQLEQALAVARERRKRERSAQPLNVGFIDVLLADILVARGASSSLRAGPPPEWHTSASGITAHGATLGVFQGADEPFPYFKARVFEAAGDGPWNWKARGSVTVAGLEPAGRH